MVSILIAIVISEELFFSILVLLILFIGLYFKGRLQNNDGKSNSREEEPNAELESSSYFDENLSIYVEDSADLIVPRIDDELNSVALVGEEEDEIGTPEVKEDGIALVIKETVEEPEPIEEIGEEETEEPALNEEFELIKLFGKYDPKLDLPDYRYPTVDLLKTYDMGKPKVSQEELEENKVTIVRTLANYGIKIAEIDATIGPTVTLYEIIPEVGGRISKIKNLEEDIAFSLAALKIRIVTPIFGKGTIGIEVPNKKRKIVPVKQVIWSEKFQHSTYDLPIVLGKTISNEVFVTDLATMPNLLIAGATGQGKTVGLNTIITSLLFKKHPSELKFVLIDLKK